MNSTAAGTAPLIIIGAARSGTNVLRDVLTELPGLSTWPCDEINYVWRHGNRNVPHDEFSPAHARPPVRAFIRSAFARQRSRSGGGMVVEKTCANALRVEFVHTVLPQARFLHIIRDGRDAVSSAIKRWRGNAELCYLARKARFVPFSDLPYYGVRFVGRRLHQFVSKDHRLPSWGPRFEGMDSYLAQHGLEQTVARQWQRSIERAMEALQRLPANRVQTIRYEDFVRDPGSVLRVVISTLGLEVHPSDSEMESATTGVRVNSVGKWRNNMEPDVAAGVEDLLDPTLRLLGYG